MPGVSKWIMQFGEFDGTNVSVVGPLTWFQVTVKWPGGTGFPSSLTVAAGANKQVVGKMDWKQIAAQLDWINVMAYDYVGSWVSNTGFNASLYASPNASGPLHPVFTCQAGAPVHHYVVFLRNRIQVWKAVNTDRDPQPVWSGKP